MTETDESHTGLEVHKAARIAALAEGGEILASADVGQNLSADINLSSPKPAKIKGVADAFEVVAVDWQSSNVSDA